MKKSFLTLTFETHSFCIVSTSSSAGLQLLFDAFHFEIAFSVAFLDGCGYFALSNEVIESFQSRMWMFFLVILH